MSAAPIAGKENLAWKCLEVLYAGIHGGAELKALKSTASLGPNTASCHFRSVQAVWVRDMLHMTIHLWVGFDVWQANSRNSNFAANLSFISRWSMTGCAVPWRHSLNLAHFVDWCSLRSLDSRLELESCAFFSANEVKLDGACEENVAETETTLYLNYTIHAAERSVSLNQCWDTVSSHLQVLMFMSIYLSSQPCISLSLQLEQRNIMTT